LKFPSKRTGDLLAQRFIVLDVLPFLCAAAAAAATRTKKEI
jgi:hypothetical protein